MADYFPVVGPTGSISFTATPPTSSSFVGWTPPADVKLPEKTKKKKKVEETKEDKAKAHSDWLKKRLEEIESKAATGKDIKELVSKARTAQAEQRLKEIESRRAPPKGITPKKWLSDPDKLKWALKRGMVKMIAKQASPESKDYENVFTLNGKRYALTDLYKAPITERIGDVKTITEVKTSLWWHQHTTAVFMGVAGVAAAYFIYNWYQKNELEKRLGRARARARGHRLAPAGGGSGGGGGHASGGYYPFGPFGAFERVPYSQFDPPASFGPWQSPYAQDFYHSPLDRTMEYPCGYSWW
jgi:hypothetical protein